jgi:hypothetical protein
MAPSGQDLVVHHVALGLSNGCFYLMFAYLTFCVVVANAVVISAGLLRPEWFVR